MVILYRSDNIIEEPVHNKYVLICSIVNSQTNTEITKIRIPLFLHLFNSNSREQCSLLEYHAIGYDRRNCHQIGFLNHETITFPYHTRPDGHRVNIFDNFITKMVLENSTNKRNFLIYNSSILYPDTDTLNINNEELYSTSYPKHLEYFCAEINFAAGIIESTVTSRTFGTDNSKKIKEQYTLPGEHILIANRYLPVYFINTNNYMNSFILKNIIFFLSRITTSIKLIPIGLKYVSDNGTESIYNIPESIDTRDLINHILQSLISSVPIKTDNGITLIQDPEAKKLFKIIDTQMLFISNNEIIHINDYNTKTKVNNVCKFILIILKKLKENFNEIIDKYNKLLEREDVAVQNEADINKKIQEIKQREAEEAMKERKSQKSSFMKQEHSIISLRKKPETFQEKKEKLEREIAEKKARDMAENTRLRNIAIEELKTNPIAKKTRSPDLIERDEQIRSSFTALRLQTTMSFETYLQDYTYDKLFVLSTQKHILYDVQNLSELSPILSFYFDQHTISILLQIISILQQITNPDDKKRFFIQIYKYCKYFTFNEEERSYLVSLITDIPALSNIRELTQQQSYNLYFLLKIINYGESSIKLYENFIELERWRRVFPDILRFINALITGQIPQPPLQSGGSINNVYKQKYLKYKAKYLELKNQMGMGGNKVKKIYCNGPGFGDNPNTCDCTGFKPQNVTKTNPTANLLCKICTHPRSRHNLK